MIGASLRDQTEMFWLSVKNRLSQGQSIGESHEINLIERMAISINYLPEKVKECFLDLCSFPEDKQIPLDALINMWVEIHDIPETEAYAIVVELSNKNLITLMKEPRYATSKIFLTDFISWFSCFTCWNKQKGHSNTLLMF